MNEMDRLYAEITMIKSDLSKLTVQQAKTETLMKAVIAIGSLLVINIIPIAYRHLFP